MGWEYYWKLSSLMSCLYSCSDHTSSSSRFLTCRIWNQTEKPIDLQIRVGSILKKAHTLRPGRSKRLRGKSIHKAYIPSAGGRAGSFYCDDTCKPYIWVHDRIGDFSRAVKQQYISLDDLRDCSEIRIFKDHDSGCIVVRKKSRPEHYFC